MLAYESIKSALDAQPLFEAKTWQLSPDAWPLTREQVAELEQIGTACLEFHQALETLYFRSAAGKNLLRNKPLVAPWVAEYLDRGKPASLVAHARDSRLRGQLPPVIRPDLLLTDHGFALTELDSVPGGIGLTAFLNRLYEGEGARGKGPAAAGIAAGPAAPTPNLTLPTSNLTPARGAIIGAGDAMVEGFYQSLAALLPQKRTPLLALLVSDEASTYRPEMQWLARELQRQGRRVVCLRPDGVFPLGGALFFDVEGTPEKIDIIYRFFELFDLGNIRTARYFFEAWHNGEVVIAPPMRPFQEEKLALALFHHHLLQDFWSEHLGGRSLKLLRQLIPMSWVMDPAPLPPGAVLDGPRVGGRALADWNELAQASQKERDLIIKISGYHETAWGARSVVLGSDCSREEWQAGIAQALQLAPTNLHVLQDYQKPRRVKHPVYHPAGSHDRAGAAHANEAQPSVVVAKDEGRLRLCPYFFTIDGAARLAGALATFCPPDKKIIHGMQDAVLLPCRVSD
ncbi:MAG TPA: hypothetical protein VLW52_12655 [Opitutaceae bacterium]|nr:hypothetical protein [Opitutaceae bacterium]